MKAVVFNGIDAGLAYKSVPDPKLPPGAVLVELRASALNRRDYWITQGLYPGSKPNVILGSDGAGLVDGQRVLINPNINWGTNPEIFSSEYQILGMPKDGTFAEKIAIDSDRLHDVPEHLSFPEAAALPLAGLTAFRVLFKKGNLQKTDNILITGIGGGVALMACQFAVANRNRVFVSSSKDEKIEKALSLGAENGVNYTRSDWHKELVSISGGIDVIIDSSGGPGFKYLTACTNPGGRIVVYGGTQGKIDGLSPQSIFWKQVSILGSTMGNDSEFIDMLDFVRHHQITPVVDSSFELKDAKSALNKMENMQQFGKIILQH